LALCRTVRPSHWLATSPGTHHRFRLPPAGREPTKTSPRHTGSHVQIRTCAHHVSDAPSRTVRAVPLMRAPHDDTTTTTTATTVGKPPEPTPSPHHRRRPSHPAGLATRRHVEGERRRRGHRPPSTSSSQERPVVYPQLRAAVSRRPLARTVNLFDVSLPGGRRVRDAHTGTRSAVVSTGAQARRALRGTGRAGGSAKVRTLSTVHGAEMVEDPNKATEFWSARGEARPQSTKAGQPIRRHGDRRGLFAKDLAGSAKVKGRPRRPHGADR